MGKRKLEIKEIDTKERLQVTFTKRRQGLFNKAAELCILCDAEIAVIAFSPAGKPFSFGHPSADKAINRYVSGDTTSTQNFGDTTSNEKLLSQLNELERQLIKNKRMKCHVEAKENLIGGYLWDQVDVAAIDSVEQLESLMEELETVRAKALGRLEEVVGDAVGSIARVEMEQLLVGSVERVEEHWFVGPSAAAESLTMDLEDYGVLDEEFWNQLEPLDFTI